MVAKKLSQHLKKLYKPQIEQRDGKACFYCGNLFQSRLMDLITISTDKNPPEFDHLNNDKEDNRLENLVIAHKKCNIRKDHHQDWINKARQKLRDNERSANIPISHADTMKETATETDTNAIFCDIVIKELAKYLQPNKDGEAKRSEILFTPFLNHLTGMGYKMCGHASQITMRRIVEQFTSDQFMYIREKNSSKKTIIRLRTEEELDSEDF